VLLTRNRKDFSQKAVASFAFKVEPSEKIYALRQVGGDEKPDFSELIYQGEVNNFYDLPAPTTEMADYLYFVRSENAYYIISTDELVAEWSKAADNTSDYLKIIPMKLQRHASFRALTC
jgi:hypothetical protein